LTFLEVKTKITDMETGFDFHGQNIREFSNEKLLIRSSKENFKITTANSIKTGGPAFGNKQLNSYLRIVKKRDKTGFYIEIDVLTNSIKNVI
jgi:hypothetical protein